MNFPLELLVLACHVNYFFLETFYDFVPTLESVLNHLLHVADFGEELRLDVLHLSLEGEQAGVGGSEPEVEAALATR